MHILDGRGRTVAAATVGRSCSRRPSLRRPRSYNPLRAAALTAPAARSSSLE